MKTYIDMTKEKLREWESKVKERPARDVRSQERWSRYQDKKDKLDQKLESMKDSGQERWEQLKEEAERLTDELRADYEEAMKDQTEESMPDEEHARDRRP